MEHGVRVLSQLEWEYKREHVIVSGVMLVVDPCVLDLRKRQDLVEEQ